MRGPEPDERLWCRARRQLIWGVLLDAIDAGAAATLSSPRAVM